MNTVSSAPKRGSVVNPMKPVGGLKSPVRATAVSTVEKSRPNPPSTSIPSSKSERVSHEVTPATSANAITPAINDTGHMPFFYTTVTNILTSIRLEEGFVREFLGHLEYKIDRRYVRKLLLDKDTRKQLSKVVVDIQEFLDKQAYLQKVVLIQSLARRSLVLRKYRDLTEHQCVLMRKYNGAFRALIKQERDYVNNLNTLVNVYMAGLKKLTQESKPIIEPQDIAIVFWNLEQIYAYHQISLKAFEDVRHNHWPFLEGLADAVIKMVTSIGIYADYVNNFRTAQDAVSRLKKKPKFSAILEEIMQKNKVQMELQEMLSIPMDQLNVYEKSLEALLDSTPFPSSEEADGLSTAYSIIKSTSNVVKQSVEKSKNKATIMAIQRAIYGHVKGPLNLLTQNRFFLREAEVFYVGKNKSKRRLILFSDCFLVVKEKKEKEDKHLKFYLMESFQDGDVADAESAQKHGFEIKASSGGKHLFSARNPEEKNMLMKDIKGIIQKLKSSRVFGTPLEDLLKKEKQEKNRTTDIPILVERLVNEILSRGLQSEGIFRLSGSATNIQVLHKQLDDSVMMDIKNEDVYELAALLKMFFREFPEPLMTFALYDQMIEVQKNFEYDSSISLYSHLTVVNTALLTMPKANQTLLKYLIDFLHKITQHSAKNKMGPQNLAIVFGPNFLWPREETIQSTLNIPRVSALVQVMTENHFFILPSSPMTEEEFNKVCAQQAAIAAGASESGGTLRVANPKAGLPSAATITYRQLDRKDSSMIRASFPRGSAYANKLYSNTNAVNVPFTPPNISKDYLDSLASDSEASSSSSSVFLPDLCVDGVDLSQVSPSPSPYSMSASSSTDRLAPYDGEASEESNPDLGPKVPPFSLNSLPNTSSFSATVPNSLPSPVPSLSPRANLGKPSPSVRFGVSNNSQSAAMSSSSTPLLTSTPSSSSLAPGFSAPAPSAGPGAGVGPSATPSFGQVKRPGGFALPPVKPAGGMFGSAAMSSSASSTTQTSPATASSAPVSPRGAPKPLPRPPIVRKTGQGLDQS